MKINAHTDFTLTRESGNRLYEDISEFLSMRSDITKIVFDFEDVSDVSTSFIQATILKLIKNNYKVESINYNQSIRFKMATLVKIARIDPHIFKKADCYPQSPVFV
ncbi:MAG: hypothetical protein HQ521_20425 [Bacteroidetes bacterium]|nr:hypothetical protein [Bacteroidota bacterium]